MDGINELFFQCKDIEEIKKHREKVELEIVELKNQDKGKRAIIEEEIKIIEDELKELNQKIKNCGNNVEIIRYRAKDDLVLAIEKDSVARSENCRDEHLERLFAQISGYKNTKLYEDESQFYFAIENGYLLQKKQSSDKMNFRKATSNNIDQILSDHVDEISLECLVQSKRFFKIKSKCARVLYNLILKKSKIEVTKESFKVEVRAFNDFFASTSFFKDDLDDLEVKIILKHLRDTLLEFKNMNDLQNISDSLVSTNVVEFVKIIKLLAVYKTQEKLIKPNTEQAIKNFFSTERSNSLFEKLVNFSDACYFSKKSKNMETADLQENAFRNVYSSFEFELRNQDDAENLRQITRAFSDKVDLVFKNHWKDTLKLFLYDKIYEAFFEYIASLEEIKEYDAFELTAISKILVEIGVERLEDFPKIFITKKKSDCEITDEEFDMIMEKIVF
ncbi:hypothetical protein M153_1570001722 [Pseudoloma neurophilia]|uniref:Uncharacterized protein n=1 Tax=Pseudoloma neurophilia TaxID=146866 RepID=A0A0R0M567_9MICR|nr:hypothetical protein M153_1570001722 [Pseudoloma neurophilia]